MTSSRHRMLEDLQRRGLAPRTQPCDIEAVKHRSPHDRRAPDQRNEAEIRQDFRSRLNEKKVAERTFRIHLDGIRFFDEITRQRPWPVLTLMRPRHSQKLPVVLSPREVRSRLASVVNPKAGMCLRMLYACGWRLREGTHLQVADIDPDRMLVRVRQGHGGQDRLVPLAHGPWSGGGSTGRARTPGPGCAPRETSRRLSRRPPSRRPARAWGASVASPRRPPSTRCGTPTPRISWRAGCSRRVIQALRGHQSPRTTARDTPLTPKTFDVVQATSNALMADL